MTAHVIVAMGAIASVRSPTDLKQVGGRAIDLIEVSGPTRGQWVTHRPTMDLDLLWLRA